MYVDCTHGSQSLDLRSQYYYDSVALLPRNFLTTSDSWGPLIRQERADQGRLGIRCG